MSYKSGNLRASNISCLSQPRKHRCPPIHCDFCLSLTACHCLAGLIVGCVCCDWVVVHNLHGKSFQKLGCLQWFRSWGNIPSVFALTQLFHTHIISHRYYLPCTVRIDLKLPMIRWRTNTFHSTNVCRPGPTSLLYGPQLGYQKTCFKKKNISPQGGWLLGPCYQLLNPRAVPSSAPLPA